MKLIGCTPDGTPDGSLLKVGRAHSRHLRHHSVHVLAVAKGEGRNSSSVLVRQREHDAPRYPGLLTTTVGAHLLTQTSPQDVIDTASEGTGVGLGALSYVGAFEVADGVENEICSLWTAEADIRMATSVFLRANVHEIERQRITPHLAESLKLWVTKQ
ncbi:hypothetical protein [Williamsia sp. 1135]|uniref:hypothetical protein n=1 Tax=Williamsia sp. 1135 TaxID=1889262 RepID=UPI000A1077EC|nr:hypothetical protein [Williamsia sp. 1135]ORM27802.1 hypothetical protein BFL43_22175 [Williamsia sp. 1135]